MIKESGKPFFLEHLIIDVWYKSDRRYEDKIHVMYVCRTL